VALERSTKLTIFVGDKSYPVEKYAAEELAKYIYELWKFRPAIVSDHVETFAGPAILLGSPSTNLHVARLARNLKWDQITADGFYIKTVGTEPDVLVIGGRLPRGTLFGVYNIVERWGMRFSLTEDIFPVNPAPLSLGSFDEKFEPSYATRAMRPSNNLPEGSAPWDLSDFKRFIDQMAKLKYNTYNFVIQESGPWLDYEFRGMQRPAGDIFYGWRYKIDKNFVGKELFPGRQEFYNPVLAQAHNDEQRKQMGIGLVRSIIDHCKDRGLMSLLTFSFLEPPTAFKRKMNDWATLPLPDPSLFPKATCYETPVEEFGTNPRYSAWMNVLDPVVKELTAVRLKALIDTYPNADFYHIWVSEHRAGVVDYREVFKMLDTRYNLSSKFDLDKELNNMGTYPYGLERYQNQLKGDLLFLYLFDQIFVQDRLLEGTSKPGARIALAGVMPELWPLVARILPKGMCFDDWLEYGTHATADRIADIVPVLKAKVPTTLEIGIQDDNTMWFPQVNVESLERIIHTTAPLDLQGYVVPIWQIRQVDINCAYLARASWQPKLTAAEFYKDYLVRLVGPAAAPDFKQAQRILEKADHEIKKTLYGFAFPWPETIPGMLGGVDREAIAKIRPQFESAVAMLRRAREKATKEGLPRVEFWLKRTEFGIGWLDLGVETADLGKLLGPDLKAQTPLTQDQKQKSLESVDQLLNHTRELIEIISSDANHIGDLGQIASLNRYVYGYFSELHLELAQRSTSN
jgi:hypothetical protein